MHPPIQCDSVLIGALNCGGKIGFYEYPFGEKLRQNFQLEITQKVKEIELRYVISAEINMLILHRLSLCTSLYDIQKLRYEFWAN